MGLLLESSVRQSENINPRQFLCNRLDLLEKENPQYVFVTDDPFKIIVRNESGSDVYGTYQKKHFHPLLSLLLGPSPGYLNQMNYEGLTVYDHGNLFSYALENSDGTWTGIDRRAQQDIPLDQIQYGFDIHGTNHVIYPYGGGDDALLADRITKIFNKYGTFERQQPKKSRQSKRWYDLTRYVRTTIGLQKPVSLFELSEKIGQLKLMTEDGKLRLTDCATTKKLIAQKK